MLIWKDRAFEYAQYLKKHPKRSRIGIKTPAVIGAVLKEAHELLGVTCAGLSIPVPVNKYNGENQDRLVRELDCAVIETLHQFRKTKNKNPYDSLRGVFWEGQELYPSAGFKEKNHIQICIRNPNCIKGYFLPRIWNEKFAQV